MNKNINGKLGAIILAAGKGSRMKEKNVNKVTMRLKNKPLISYSVSLLEQMKISPVIVVVGHAKASVQNALNNRSVIYVEQKKRLGTGHAVKSALNKIPGMVNDVLVLYGDDSYIYNEELLNKIIDIHYMKKAALTFLTIEVDSPAGLGRIIRNNVGQVIDIIEEKDATSLQKKIKEINPNCYIFRSEFLKKYIPKIPRSPVTHEYYLPAIIKLARDNNEIIEVVAGGFLAWRGINTKEELREAEEKFIL